MRTITSYFETAKNKTGATPVWLLQVDSGASTYYYSDRAVTVDSQSYDARVVSWGKILGSNKRMSGGGVINTTMVSLSELPTSVSSYIEVGNECRIYLWFDGESLDDTLMLYKGVIVDPLEFTETTITFSIAGYESKVNKTIGTTIETATFPQASEYSVGKVKPIVYGNVYDHECLPVDAGSVTTLTSELSKTETTTISVSSTASFPSTGSLWVEGEKITYGSKTSTTFTTLSRAQSSTKQTAHSRGAYVIEDQSQYDYLIADHSVGTPAAVYINGMKLTSGWAKLSYGYGDILRITDTAALRDALQASVVDDLGATSSTTENAVLQSSTISDIYASSSMTSSSYNSPWGGSRYCTWSVDSDISFSKVEVICTYSNLSGLRFKYYTGPSYSYQGVFTVFDLGSDPGGSYDKQSGAASVQFAANDDITKVKAEYHVDNSPGTGTVSYNLIQSLGVRTASKSITITTTKDDYAYASGISTTETLQGARVSVDITGYAKYSPPDIIEHLIQNYSNDASAALDGSISSDTEGFSTNYNLGFSITDKVDLSELCRQIAFQSASRFFWDAGTAYLKRLPLTSTVQLPTGWTASSGLTVFKAPAAGNSVKISGSVGDYIEYILDVNTYGVSGDNYVGDIWFWYKTDGTAQIKIHIIEDDGYETTIKTETAWTQLNATPSNTDGTVKIRFEIVTAAGDIWIDDLTDLSNNIVERFISWTGSTPDNWIISGATTSKDVKRDGVYSLGFYAANGSEKLSIVAAASSSASNISAGWITKTVGSALAAIKITDGSSESEWAAKNLDWGLKGVASPLSLTGDLSVELGTLDGGLVYFDSVYWNEPSFDEEFSSWTGTVDKAIIPHDVSLNSMKVRTTPYSDIVNSIDCRYDFRQGEYFETYSNSDSPSVVTYGTKDGSLRFQLNLVNDSVSAENTVDDYIAKLKDPKSVYKFTTPLSNVELQRGDIISITHGIKGGIITQMAEIMTVEIDVGSTGTSDTITFTAEEI